MESKLIRKGWEVFRRIDVDQRLTMGWLAIDEAVEQAKKEYPGAQVKLVVCDAVGVPTGTLSIMVK